LNIYSECYPSGKTWCGFYGKFAIVYVAVWFILLSIFFLAVHVFRRYRGTQ
jgi:hypothetical protein